MSYETISWLWRLFKKNCIMQRVSSVPLDSLLKDMSVRVLSYYGKREEYIIADDLARFLIHLRRASFLEAMPYHIDHSDPFKVVYTHLTDSMHTGYFIGIKVGSRRSTHILLVLSLHRPVGLMCEPNILVCFSATERVANAVFFHHAHSSIGWYFNLAMHLHCARVLRFH